MCYDLRVVKSKQSIHSHRSAIGQLMVHYSDNIFMLFLGLFVEVDSFAYPLFYYISNISI